MDFDAAAAQILQVIWQLIPLVLLVLGIHLLTRPKKRKRKSLSEVWVPIVVEIPREGRHRGRDCNHVAKDDIVLPDGQNIGWMCIVCREAHIRPQWIEHGTV